MEIKVNYFIRTIQGDVGQVISVQKEKVLTDKGTFHITQIKLCKEIPEDLIEVGDHINGARVYKHNNILSINGHSIKANYLKSMITHEKIENNTYYLKNALTDNTSKFEPKKHKATLTNITCSLYGSVILLANSPNDLLTKLLKYPEFKDVSIDNIYKGLRLGRLVKGLYLKRVSDTKFARLSKVTLNDGFIHDYRRIMLMYNNKQPKLVKQKVEEPKKPKLVSEPFKYSNPDILIDEPTDADLRAIEDENRRALFKRKLLKALENINNDVTNS